MSQCIVNKFFNLQYVGMILIKQYMMHHKDKQHQQLKYYKNLHNKDNIYILNYKIYMKNLIKKILNMLPLKLLV